MAAWGLGGIPDQSGRLAVVTGATGGIGIETAIGLAGAGAAVVLAGRNPAKGAAAEALIRDRHPNVDVRWEMADMASLDSIGAFADRQLAAGRPINILINNAGVMALPTREVTGDGFEKQFGTNYLSHFALTAKLLPLLTVAKARVVQIASIAHRSGAIRLGDLNYAQGYKSWAVYSQSKLAMLMFAIELDRRSKANGWGLTSVAAHPGVARTDLVANGPASGGNPVMPWMIDVVGRFIGHSAAAGALPTLMAATLPHLRGGEYFGPQGFKELRGPPGLGKIESKAQDADVAARLWTESERLTGIAFG